MPVKVTRGRALRSPMSVCRLQLRSVRLTGLECLLSGVHWCNLSDQKGEGVSMNTAVPLSCAATNKP